VLISDGAYDTTWQCSSVEQFIAVELAGVRPVSGFDHALGPSAYGAPRRLRVDVSFDGITWRAVWSGGLLSETVRAAIEDPARVALRLTFQPVSARWVRLVRIDDEPDAPWAIAELSILEAS
jgi:hypothetical protein